MAAGKIDLKGANPSAVHIQRPVGQTAVAVLNVDVVGVIGFVVHKTYLVKIVVLSISVFAVCIEKNKVWCYIISVRERKKKIK